MKRDWETALPNYHYRMPTSARKSSSGILKVGVIYGGKSAEHDVSIESAKNVMAAIDSRKYEVVPIYIAKDGSGLDTIRDIDIAFPVLHGPNGEDGTMQGALRLLGIPFVGSDVLGSAVCMDKDVMKRLLKEAGLPIPKFQVVRSSNLTSELGFPVFVKPANMGSSVGISKVKNEEELVKAIDTALQFDHKVLIEEAIFGKEIECSVLNGKVSKPGRVIPKGEFYSYEAKYVEEDGASFEVPAILDDDVVIEIQRLSVEAFNVLCCEQMARVDFFIRENSEILINEVNTIPGFTNISLYPRLWEESGLGYKELIDCLLESTKSKMALATGAGCPS